MTQNSKTTKRRSTGERSNTLLIAVLALAISFLLAGRTFGQLPQVAWSELGAHVADRLIPLSELSLRDWSEKAGVDERPARTVVQVIENVVYEWQEFDDVGADGVRRVRLRMIQPELRDLTIEEAQLLLTASAGWMESVDKNAPQSYVVDANLQPVLPVREPFLSDDGLYRFDAGAPKSVIGTDDRRRVTNTTEFPWRAICHLSMVAANGNGYRGTGFLVGPRTVLTNGHMVFGASDGGFAREITVTPGQRQDYAGGPVTRPYGSQTSRDLRTNTQYASTESSEYDYAAVILSEPFAGISTYMPLVFDESPSSVNLAGYPGQVGSDTNTMALWHSYSSVAAVESRVVRYTADSSGGNSGGPVWVFDGATGSRRVVAIHAFGGSTTNGGPRLISSNRDLIMQWVGGGTGGSTNPPTNPTQPTNPTTPTTPSVPSRPSSPSGDMCGGIGFPILFSMFAGLIGGTIRQTRVRRIRRAA